MMPFWFLMLGIATAMEFLPATAFITSQSNHPNHDVIDRRRWSSKHTFPSLIRPVKSITNALMHQPKSFHPYISSSSSSSSLLFQSSKEENENEQKSLADIALPPLQGPDIPEEYREDIFRAEANTPAAKDRQGRVTTYLGLATIGVAVASFNLFLGNLQDSGDFGAGTAFDGVASNGFLSFLFLNKIGGGIALVTAGICATMIELEERTKNENAEKIWKELERRKQSGSSSDSKGNRRQSSNTRKSRKKQKSKKRLNALSEVIMEEKVSTADATLVTQQEEEQPSSKSSSTVDEENGGIFGKMKNFYDQADRMAASQALLLNKEMEDRGIIDKITDESGLRVIGKEEAEKIAKNDNNESNTKQ